MGSRDGSLARQRPPGTGHFLGTGVVCPRLTEPRYKRGSTKSFPYSLFYVRNKSEKVAGLQKDARKRGLWYEGPTTGRGFEIACGVDSPVRLLHCLICVHGQIAGRFRGSVSSLGTHRIQPGDFGKYAGIAVNPVQHGDAARQHDRRARGRPQLAAAPRAWGVFSVRPGIISSLRNIFAKKRPRLRCGEVPVQACGHSARH